MYEQPITYEDPPYMHSSQMTLYNDKIVVPKGGNLSFNYNMPAYGTGPGGGLRQTPTELRAAVTDALSNILNSYSASGGVGTFKVVEDNGLFHVIPVDTMSRQGKVQAITPLLDTSISISQGQRTGAELVSEICDTLSGATGQNVVMGTTPYNLLAQHLTTIAGVHVTARAMLTQLFTEINWPLSWQLFYDPGRHEYVLNIHDVMNKRAGAIHATQ
jgi:hypothetical protein